MKQLAKLFILFVAMSVLTSSSKDSGSSKRSQAAVEATTTCPFAKKDEVAIISCKESTAAEKSEAERALSLADNEISLSPISRFILVQ